MRIPLPFPRVVLAFTVSAAFMIGYPAQASRQTGFAMSAPQGFDDLMSERQAIVDVYFGGRKLGEARANIRPGYLRLEDPQAVAALIPDIIHPPDLASALGEELDSNVALACGRGTAQGCGTLQPERVGIILDEDRFRLDIFINPTLLATPEDEAAGYLAKPEEQPALVSLFGATLSGSTSANAAYHFQNRSVASIGSLRLRSDSSLASRKGLSFDNLTLEADRADWRYAGGLFWAPGTDLIGRRRILGLGASTQLDTRSDKDLLIGTPLTIFLQNSARVEILVDGRLVSSRIYPAGNRVIDTSELPSGSYDILLRIQEDGRPAREERQFFTKGSQMAPLGRPLFSIFAGLLPSSDRGFGLAGNRFFYEASAAYRLSPRLGIHGTVLGTQDKILLEGGALLHTGFANVGLEGLVSSSRDFGAALRLSSTGRGPLAFSFDLRKVKSRDGRPLLPINNSGGTFSEDPELKFGDRSSYTQGLAILSYRLRNATLRANGLYRRNASDQPNYSVGASLEVPVLRTGRGEILLQADARKTERDVASFLGVRFLTSQGSMAFTGSAGRNFQSRRGSQTVGELQAAWYRQQDDFSQISGDAAVGRDGASTYARASGYVRSPIGNARADVLHNFGKNGGSTQVAASVNGGLVLTKGAFGIGGSQMSDAAVLVSVAGGEAGQDFEVLVDDVVRATVGSGASRLIFLPPYEAYDVRIRPRRAQMSSYDGASRKVTLYPGNVVKLDWNTTPLVVLFGRAIRADGMPVSNGDISGSHSIGRTDEDGYFQIEAKQGETIMVNGQQDCRMAAPTKSPVNGYVSAGEITCD